MDNTHNAFEQSRAGQGGVGKRAERYWKKVDDREVQLWMAGFLVRATGQCCFWRNPETEEGVGGRRTALARDFGSAVLFYFPLSRPIMNGCDGL